MKSYPRKQFKKYFGIVLLLLFLLAMVTSCGMAGQRVDNAIEGGTTATVAAVGGTTGAAIAGPGGAGAGAFLGALTGWLFSGGPEEPPAPPASGWDAVIASTEMLTTLAILAAILLLVPSPLGLLKKLRTRVRRIFE